RSDSVLAAETDLPTLAEVPGSKAAAWREPEPRLAEPEPLLAKTTSTKSLLPEPLLAESAGREPLYAETLEPEPLLAEATHTLEALKPAEASAGVPLYSAEPATRQVLRACQAGPGSEVAAHH